MGLSGMSDKLKHLGLGLGSELRSSGFFVISIYWGAKELLRVSQASDRIVRKIGLTYVVS